MFGDNLKKYRTQKGLSQSDIAEKMFVTRQCVSKWEKGVTQPDLQALAKLSELLEVSVDALVQDCDTVDQPPSSDHNVGLFTANILAAVFCVLAFAAIWRHLPQTIPAHWTHGTIDRYGSRNEVFINIVTIVVLLLTDITVFFAVKRVRDKRVVYIAHGIIILFQIANLVFIIAIYAEYLSNVLSFVTCLTADLLACVFAATHPKLTKPNGLLGVRTETTLGSPVVWNKTNALACYLFTGCSLIIFTINMIWSSIFLLLCFSAYIPLTVTVVLYAERSSKHER